MVLVSATFRELTFALLTVDLGPGTAHGAHSLSAATALFCPQVFEAGMCGCLGYDLFQGDDWQTIYYNSTINFDDVLSEYDDDTKREVVAAVCSSTIHDGDHLTVSFFCRACKACLFLSQQYSILSPYVPP